MAPADQQDARARKRERDKFNQRQKRRRERDALQDLEKRNELLEQQVKALRSRTAPDFQRLSNTIETLEAANRDLKSRLSQVDEFVRSWNSSVERMEPPVVRQNQFSEEREATMPSPWTPRSAYSTPSAVAIAGPSNGSDHSFEAREQSIHMTPVASPALDHRETHTHKVTVSELKLRDILALPPWRRLPANLKFSDMLFQPAFDPFTSTMERLQSSAEAFNACPPYPRALDLLHGDSSNELANVISSLTYPNPSRKTEKLAYQWYSYMVARWQIQPTEDNFNRIPVVLRPTPRQLFVPHAPIFDYIVWPQMRDNLIAAGVKYCRPEVFGLLFVTCRLKGTPNADYLFRIPGGELQIDPEFLNKMSNADSWVLLEKFWHDYPELVRGLDPSTVMISEKDLV